MARLRRRKKTLLFFVALVVYGACVGLLIRERYIRLTTEEPIPEVSVHLTPPKPVTDLTLPPVKQPLPAEATIDVPFMVQAPLGNWDAVHEETCEEASLMMLKYFLAGQAFGSSDAQEQELQKLVHWEADNDYKVDVTVAEVSRIARDYYSLHGGRVIENPSVTDIKAEIAAGRPVIVPAAGQVLKNPYFTPPGPKYHMVVIRGYTDTEFITNDPGTRRGKEFRYPHANLMEAMHDWNSTNILAGRKAVLVFDS